MCKLCVRQFYSYRILSLDCSAEFLSYGLGGPTSCGMRCRLLWDGFGRWRNGTWKPHLQGGVVSMTEERLRSVSYTVFLN